MVYIPSWIADDNEEILSPSEAWSSSTEYDQEEEQTEGEYLESPEEDDDE